MQRSNRGSLRCRATNPLLLPFLLILATIVVVVTFFLQRKTERKEACEIERVWCRCYATRSKAFVHSGRALGRPAIIGFGTESFVGLFTYRIALLETETRHRKKRLPIHRRWVVNGLWTLRQTFARRRFRADAKSAADSSWHSGTYAENKPSLQWRRWNVHGRLKGFISILSPSLGYLPSSWPFHLYEATPGWNDTHQHSRMGHRALAPRRIQGADERWLTIE